jgi:hypothetical protein
MKRALIVAATAVVLVGGSALAYKAYARYDGWGHGRYHSRMSADDMSAFADARIAALKAGLQLNAEQEKLWPPVETALKEFSAKRIEHREAFRAQSGERRDRAERGELSNPIERMRKGAERMSEMGADMKRLADAADPLYQSLDEAQQRRFNALAHSGMHGMHRGRNERGWRRHGELGEGRMGGHHMDGQMGPRHGGGYEGRHPHMGPRGGDGEQRGPGWRHRTGGTGEMPQGAERL